MVQAKSKHWLPERQQLSSGDKLELMQEWAHSKGTAEFVGSVQDALQELKNRWAAGQYSNDVLNAAALGEVRAYEEVLAAVAEWSKETVGGTDGAV